MGANSLVAKTNGYTNIVFDNNKAGIYLQYPNLSLTGISFGKRVANFVKKSYCYYDKYNYLCEMTFNPDSGKGLFGMGRSDLPNDFF